MAFTFLGMIFDCKLSYQLAFIVALKLDSMSKASNVLGVCGDSVDCFFCFVLSQHNNKEKLLPVIPTLMSAVWT